MPLFDRPGECCHRCHFVTSVYEQDYYVCETGMVARTNGIDGLERLQHLTETIRNSSDRTANSLGAMETHVLTQTAQIPELQEMLLRYADG